MPPTTPAKLHPSTEPEPAPPGTPKHDEQALDEALRESFPASDPIAVTIEHSDPPAVKPATK